MILEEDENSNKFEEEDDDNFFNNTYPSLNIENKKVYFKVKINSFSILINFLFQKMQFIIQKEIDHYLNKYNTNDFSLNYIYMYLYYIRHIYINHYIR